nr:ribosomal protein S6 [Cryptomonas borealis]
MSFVFYETVCLLNPELSEDALLKILDRYRGILVERGAKNIVIENKGKRHLKYPIKGFIEVVYVQMTYYVNGEVVELLEKSLRISEFVIRYLTMRVPEI